MTGSTHSSQSSLDPFFILSRDRGWRVLYMVGLISKWVSFLLLWIDRGEKKKQNTDLHNNNIKSDCSACPTAENIWGVPRHVVKKATGRQSIFLSQKKYQGLQLAKPSEAKKCSFCLYQAFKPSQKSVVNARLPSTPFKFFALSKVEGGHLLVFADTCTNRLSDAWVKNILCLGATW